MIRTQRIGSLGVVAVTALAVFSSPAPAQRLAQFSSYSASGTHSCGEGAGARSCIVTGLSYSHCIDAESALRLQDCCRSSQTCSRDAQTGERRCEGGGKSVAFRLNYCIGGR